MVGSEHLLLLLAAILIGAVATAGNLGSAIFCVPVIILLVRPDPRLALGAGLLVEVFFLVSRLRHFARQKAIDYPLGLHMALIAFPFTLLGLWVASWLAADMLLLLIGVGLLGVALSCFKTPDRQQIEYINRLIDNQYGAGLSETQITTATDDYFSYTPRQRDQGRAFAGLQGLLVGLIANNLGQYNNYFWLQVCRVPFPVSEATGVLIYSLIAGLGALGYLVQFFGLHTIAWNSLPPILLVLVPGVLLGSMFGQRLSAKVSGKRLNYSLGMAFVGLAIFVLARPYW